MPTRLLDHGNDPFCIGQYLVVPKAQHQPATLLQELVAPIMFARLCVLPAIRFDRDRQRWTGKIEDERRDWMLPTEMPADAVAT
jgi:hypothetical protein